MTESPHLVPPAVSSQTRQSSRFPFAFGRRFYLLLFIGLVWLGPAWSDPRFLYAMFAWDFAIILLWFWDLSNVPKPGQLDATRIWTTSAQLLAQSEVRIEVRNRGNSPVFVEAMDEVPPAIRSDAAVAEFAVPPNEAASANYSILPRERGDIELGNLYLRCQSSWRIAERWASAALKQTIRIYPNLEESKRDMIYLIRSRQVALQVRHKHLRGHGREFESLREYREGDEWRNICWTAAARRGKLISKTYQFERSQTVWIVLDSGRLLRAQARGLAKLDYTVSAALSLAQVALYSGDRVALLAYGRRVKQRIPAGRGAAHVRSLIEGLAQIRVEEFEADHLHAAETLLATQKRRCLIVWFTDLAETAAIPDVVESASRLARRHLFLLTVIGQPELQNLMDTQPENESQMYHYVAAQEVGHRRDLLLRMLRQLGVLTLEIEPAKISSAVVNQYLMTKERGMV